MPDMTLYAPDRSASVPDRLQPGTRTEQRMNVEATPTPAPKTGLAARAGRISRALATAALCGAALTGSACNSFYSYLGTEAAHKPPPASKVQVPTPPGQAPLKLYGGDMAFRISPPDRADEIKRSRDTTLLMMRRSKLDFVMMTPRVPARFFLDAKEVDRVKQEWTELRQKLDTVPDPKPLLLTGLTYVDDQQGSASVLFIDVPALLHELPPLALKHDPGLFFRVAHALGGVIVAKHPLATPAKVPVDSPMRYARRDRSWHPLTQPQEKEPPDIVAADEMMFGMEAYNVPVSIWRDKLAYDDEQHSIGEVLRRMDEEIFRRGRRLVPVGGTDSRDKLMRATTFIAASGLNPQALREGLLRGRVCVRSPQPCSLRVYVDDEGLPQGVGAAVRAKRQVEFDWTGEGELFRDGESLGTFSGKANLAADGQCHLFRLAQEGGYSAPVYVNCTFAEVMPL